MNKNLKKKFNRKKLKRLIEKSYQPKNQNENPFDSQHNKRKSVIKTSKESLGLKRAEQKRKETLLVEYKKRNVRNKTIDLRIGNNTMNNTFDSKKLIKEKQIQSKRNIFNLNDNEELTHMGTKLSEIESFEKLNEQMEDKEINADLVSKLHFGGFESNGENGKETKTYLQELISINKKEKYEKQVEKENLDEFRERLDQTWKELRMMVSSSYNKKDVVENIDNSINKKEDSVIKDHSSVPSIEDKKQEKTFELESYDAIFKSLQYENKVTDDAVTAANKTLLPLKSDEIKTSKNSDYPTKKEKESAKNKKYVSTYSADALSFDECVDYGSNPKDNENATSNVLGPKFELVYDEEGHIASSLLQNLTSPGEEMKGNDFRGGDKFLSKASGIVKDLKINLFPKSTSLSSPIEIEGKEDLIALPFFSYQNFCEKLNANLVANYVCLLAVLDDPNIYKSSEALLPTKKYKTEGDKNLFITLNLISNTLTFTLRYMAELSLSNDQDACSEIYEKLCSALVDCKFFASRPNLICLVMDEIVASLSRCITAYTTKTFLARAKKSEKNMADLDTRHYPGRKMFSFTNCLATLLRHLRSTDFAKLRQKVVYLLNLNLSHCSHLLRLKEAQTSTMLNDLVRRACHSIDSLVNLPSPTKPSAVYYPEPFAFFNTALEIMTANNSVSTDNKVSKEMRLLLDTLSMFLRFCLSPKHFTAEDSKLNIVWSPLLAAFPELLKELKNKLHPITNPLVNCEESSKVIRFIEDAIAEIKSLRSSHYYALNPTQNSSNSDGKTMKYPKLLEPLVEAPKHSAAWRREQRNKVLKTKKVAVKGEKEDHYLATPESLTERKRLKHMYKRDLKTAKKELRKDALFLARHQLEEQMDKDRSRKEKVKKLYAILADQEGECRAIKKTKIRAKF